MKNFKSALSRGWAAAILTLFVVPLARTLIAADAPAPVARIAGVWPTHFGNGVSRVYRIRNDGSVSYEQQDPAESESSKLTTSNGEFVAEFGGRLMGFYRISEDLMNVAIFSSKDTFDAHKPSVTGKAYRAVAAKSNSTDPIRGTWKWLLDEKRSLNGMVEFKADGTFAMIGTSKIGTWKFIADRIYILNWISLGSEDTLTLSADGNGLAGKNKSERLVFGERIPGVAASVMTPMTGSPVVAPVAAQAPPVVANPPTPALPTAVNPVEKTMRLKAGWDGPMQGGSKTLEDLAFVLNGFAKADPNPPFEDLEIYDGIKYLMPLNEAVAALRIKGRLPPMKKVVCPGFPRESLNYTSVDGLFEGHYNRVDILTDMASQVVALQFVDEHPKDTSYIHFSTPGNWLTYNFVGYRVKGLTTLSIEYVLEAYDPKQKRWVREQPHYLARYFPASPTLHVLTYLTEKHQLRAQDRRLEETLWCVPKPFASVILHCINNGQR